ncbi:MAG TPA: amidohydrolase family protein, partial [Brevibacterium senegalense]|nr:amidohydrolase family protein [Brevibacterium senegalense]
MSAKPEPPASAGSTESPEPEEPAEPTEPTGSGQTRPVFDAHLHIVDPRFPLVENNGYLPDPFTVDDYREANAHLTPHGFAVRGGAVVSGSFQAFDQGYLVDALAQLGPGFAGVTQLPVEVEDQEIDRLHAAGVRAVRFNVARGGSAALDDLEHLAQRVHDRAGWHAELYIDARTIDDDLARRIAALPAVSIDHLGMHEDGLPQLLRLVEQGVKVKATGFGRIDMDPARTLAAIVDVDPTALMVGTDLPSTRARRPFAPQDLDLIRGVLTPPEQSAVFWD